MPYPELITLPHPSHREAFLRQCGALKTHTVHRGPAISDLLCPCVDFRFILQRAERPLEEDPAKSPRSVRTIPIT